MAFVSHRGRKGSLSAAPAASRSSSSVRLHSCRRKSSSLSSAVCKTGGTSLTAACRTQTVSASRTAAERYSPKLVVCSKRAASKEAAASHTAPVLWGAAAIRSVRSTNFAMTSSSSRARKMTSPWSRAFHSVRFIILFLYTLFWKTSPSRLRFMGRPVFVQPLSLLRSQLPL